MAVIFCSLTAAYTANNIKAAILLTGIFPCNLDSVFARLTLRSVPLPVMHQTILHLKTTYNCPNFRQHSQLRINHIKECVSGHTSAAIAICHHVTHTAEPAVTTMHVTIIEAVDISVSNGSKFPGWFRVQFRPRTEPLQQVLPHENPHRCNWAGFTTKNPSFQHHKFGAN